MSVHSFVIRSISCLCLMTAWYFDVWWLGAILLAWHCYQYRAYECILIGVLIDIQFMTPLTIPWYTIGFTGAVIIAEFGKPMLRNSSHGTI